MGEFAADIADLELAVGAPIAGTPEPSHAATPEKNQ
jgi:hypothetical protein